MSSKMLLSMLPKGFCQCFRNGRFPSVFPKGLLAVLRKDFCQSFQRASVSSVLPKGFHVLTVLFGGFRQFFGGILLVPSEGFCQSYRKASVWHFRKALVIPFISPSVSSSRKLPPVLHASVVYFLSANVKFCVDPFLTKCHEGTLV